MYAVVPHHHHGNMICFDGQCVEVCNHNPQSSESEDMDDRCCHHHHAADECVLCTPFILDDGVRLLVVKSLILNTLDHSLVIFESANFVIKNLLYQKKIYYVEAKIPLPATLDFLSFGLRAPPCV